METGTRGEDGSYPAASLNGRVQARLGELAERLRTFGQGGGGRGGPSGQHGLAGDAARALGLVLWPMAQRFEADEAPGASRRVEENVALRGVFSEAIAVVEKAPLRKRLVAATETSDDDVCGAQRLTEKRVMDRVERRFFIRAGNDERDVELGRALGDRTYVDPG